MNQAYDKLAENYRLVFGTPGGHAVLEDLESAFHCNQTTFKNGTSEEMTFNEGQRAAVLYIKGMINYKPTETEEEDNDGN